MTALDPRSPYVLDAIALRRRAGTMLEVERTVEAPEGLGTDVLTVPAGSPVELGLRLESVVEGVLVSGNVHAVASGACVRCLDDVEIEVDTYVQELFVYADRAEHHHEVAPGDDEDELWTMQGDLIDLEPMIVDTVVPMLPFQPVCREDCPGLCDQCGAPLADDPDHGHEVLDPRWAALGGLLQESSQDNDERRN